MESIEVWMWVIAGLIIGSILFVAGSSLLGKYLHSQDIGLARSNFDKLAETAKRMCRFGLYSEETITLRFPAATSRIAVLDSDRIEGQGVDLCLSLRGQDGMACEKLSPCETVMNSVVLENDETAPSLLQRISQAPQASVYTFKVSKSGFDALTITWTPN